MMVMSQQKQPKKKKFKVEPGGSLSDVLAAMRLEGYQPVRRFEQPVFKEENGEITVSHQEIMFEGKLMNEDEPK